MKLFSKVLILGVILSIALVGCTSSNGSAGASDSTGGISTMRDVLGESGKAVYDNFKASECAELRYTVEGEASKTIIIRDASTIESIVNAIKGIEVVKTTDKVASDADEGLLFVMKDSGAMQFHFNDHHLQNTAEGIYYELENDAELWALLKDVSAKESTVNIEKAAYALQETEKYTCSEFSMNIPKGWKVEHTNAAGMYAAIRAYDPTDERRQLLFMLKAEPLFHDESGKEYCAMSGNTALSTAPVLYNASTEGFFQVFGEYADLLENYVEEYSSMQVPRFEGFEVVESTPNENAIAGSVNSDILRADYTVGGQLAEGLFAADIYDFSKDSGVTSFGDFGYYSVYDVYVMSTEKDALIDWQPLLNRCISSLTFTDEYIASAMAMSSEAVMTSQYISSINDQILNGIMDSWESRNTSQDIISQKQSDATFGYERVIDTDTGEIYKAYNGFTDDYNGVRFQAITDAQYAEPTSGYIEKM